MCVYVLRDLVNLQVLRASSKLPVYVTANLNVQIVGGISYCPMHQPIISSSNPASANVFVSLGKILSLDYFVVLSVIR